MCSPTLIPAALRNWEKDWSSFMKPSSNCTSVCRKSFLTCLKVRMKRTEQRGLRRESETIGSSVHRVIGSSEEPDALLHHLRAITAETSNLINSDRVIHGKPGQVR